MFYIATLQPYYTEANPNYRKYTAPHFQEGMGPPPPQTGLFFLCFFSTPPFAVISKFIQETIKTGDFKIQPNKIENTMIYKDKFFRQRDP